jgi:hypothetical protein
MGTNEARHALLARLLDHAPTFPPASLAPPEALAEDARAAASPHAFMLARLVWRSSALDEVSSSGRALSAVLDAPLAEDASVEAVEAPPFFDPGAGRAGIPASVREIYVETPLDGDLDDRLEQLAGHGLRAKIRCGGSAIPSAADLARFVRACRGHGLAFKATAGLHHAVRTDGEHGFLNLLAAAVFAGDEERSLAETQPAAFVLDAESFRWRDRSAAANDVARVRRELFHSIGTCSFFEPVEELEALGVLTS